MEIARFPVWAVITAGMGEKGQIRWTQSFESYDGLPNNGMDFVHPQIKDGEHDEEMTDDEEMPEEIRDSFEGFMKEQDGLLSQEEDELADELCFWGKMSEFLDEMYFFNMARECHEEEKQLLQKVEELVQKWGIEIPDPFRVREAVKKGQAHPKLLTWVGDGYNVWDGKPMCRNGRKCFRCFPKGDKPPTCRFANKFSPYLCPGPCKQDLRAWACLCGTS
jgi:hypothetical protein